MDVDEMIELELTNRKRIVIPFDFEKIYGVREVFYYKFLFSRRFPFVHVDKRIGTRFRLRTHYETLDDVRDPKYTVNCSIKQFYSLFNVHVIPFEARCIEGDLTA